MSLFQWNVVNWPFRQCKRVREIKLTNSYADVTLGFIANNENEESKGLENWWKCNSYVGEINKDFLNEKLKDSNEKLKNPNEKLKDPNEKLNSNKLCEFCKAAKKSIILGWIL